MGILIRFIAAGLLGTGVHFAVLALLVELVKTDVIVATTCAFISAWSVSFLAQKHWTFKDAEEKQLLHQALNYVIIALLNVGINALLMHVFAEQLAWHYLLAQFVTTAIVAAESFVLYRLFVFPRRPNA